MREGRIYFIACWPMRVVKIGYTTRDARRRLADLQTGFPGRLELYGTAPATQAEERLLHEAFMPLHVHGEWFRLFGKLHDMACYLSDCGGRLPSDRASFEGALHDVLYSGLWHPSRDESEAEYEASGNWRPFAHLIPEALEA